MARREFWELPAAALARRQNIAALARWKYRRKKGSSRIRPIFGPTPKYNGRSSRKWLESGSTLPDVRLDAT